MSGSKEKLGKFKPASPNFEFRQFPFYWVMRVANTYSMRMEKALKKANINATAWRIFMILREHGRLSVSEIATHAVAKTPTITKAIYKLQEEGLLQIETSQEDARVSIVILTAEGKKAISEIIKNTQKVFDSAFEDFSETEIKKLNIMLNKLFVNLDSH